MLSVAWMSTALFGWKGRYWFFPFYVCLKEREVLSAFQGKALSDSEKSLMGSHWNNKELTSYCMRWTDAHITTHPTMCCKSQPWGCRNIETKGPFLGAWDIPAESQEWCFRWYPSLISALGPRLGLVSHDSPHSSPSNGVYKPGFPVLKGDQIRQIVNLQLLFCQHVYFYRKEQISAGLVG